MRSYTKKATALALAASLVMATSLAAQQEERVPVDPTPGPLPSAAVPAAEPQDPAPALRRTGWMDGRETLEVVQGPYEAPSDDTPDFAPTESWGSVGEDAGRPRILKGNPYVLSFVSGDLTPEPGIDPDFLARTLAKGRAYGFIMIRGRMSAEKMARLQGLGIKLLGRHTWQSTKAEIPAAAIAELAKLPFVHWVGSSLPGQRLDSDLAKVLETAPAGEEFDIVVNLFDSDICAETKYVTVGETRALESDTVDAVSGALRYIIPNGPAHKALAEAGLSFSYYNDVIQAVRGRATKAEILAIRELGCVVFIELHAVHFGFHDQTMPMVNQDRVRSVYPGTGVPVGVIDSGLDSTPWHQDFSGKGFWGWDVTGQGQWADGQGHGTHVAGTVCGRGIANARYIGAAPAVANGGEGDRMFIGRYLKNDNFASGDVTVLYNAFANNVVSGGKTNRRPTLVNCSWGSNSSTGYVGTEAASREIDNVVHNNQQCYVFAAGNVGSTAGTWGGSPGVAKNVLTVASLRDTFSSTIQPGTPSTFTRYATKDGRRKPEVAAPGEILTSLNIDTSTGYANKSGTSMASPTVVGVLASLVDRSNFFEYKPALLKALACAAAKVGNSTGFNTVQGFGLVNSHKMNYVGRTDYTSASGTLTWPASGTADFNLTIPANAVAIKVVLAHTESAASSGAAAAVQDGLRFWMDAAPYTTGYSGEFSISNSVQNVVWGSASAATFSGKTVRCRVEVTSLGLARNVKWGVCVFCYLDSTSSSPTLTNTIDSTIVKPSASVVLTSTLAAPSNQDDFNSGRIYFNGSSSFTNTRIDRTTSDSVLQSYTGSTHPSNPYPSLGAGVTTGMTVGQGTSRAVKFTLRAPASSGSYALTTRAQHGSSTSTTLSNSHTVCVDGLAPPAIAGLQASKAVQTWYNTTNVTFSWNPAADSGCAGVSLLRRVLSSSGVSIPTESSLSLGANVVSLATNFAGAGTNHYFAIRAYDKANNIGAASSIGPFYIDQTNPVISSMNVSATKVATLAASVQVNGTDAASGVKYIQYSNNGSTWSGNFAYTTAFRSVSLSGYGGTTSEGTKTVYARLIDHAGNVSSVRSIQVQYIAPPTLVSAPIAVLEAVNYGYFQFAGTGFNETTSVKVGAQTISAVWTSAHHDWWGTGAFRVVNDSVLYVYPPQGLSPANYSVQVNNGLSLSNALPVAIVPNKGAILRTNSILRVGSYQDFRVTKAGLKPTVSQQIILASLLKTPSKFANIYNFAIGANFTQIVMFPSFGFDANGVSSLIAPTNASFLGLTAYFQAGYLDLTPAVVWPMPASDVWSTTYK